MRIFKKWFDIFSWFAVWQLLYSIFSDYSVSLYLVLFLLFISGLLALIPDKFYEKLSVQLRKDLN